MFRYAQIDKSGNIISDSFLNGVVVSDNMIPVSDDFDLTNKKYIKDVWVEYEPEAIQEPISEQDQIQAEMLLNQCNILINQENQDAVLAEVLLNQLGV